MLYYRQIDKAQWYIAACGLCIWRHHPYELIMQIVFVCEQAAKISIQLKIAMHIIMNIPC